MLKKMSDGETWNVSIRAFFFWHILLLLSLIFIWLNWIGRYRDTRRACLALTAGRLLIFSGEKEASNSLEIFCCILTIVLYCKSNPTSVGVFPLKFSILTHNMENFVNVNFLKEIESKSEVTQSCPTLCDPTDWLYPTRLLHPWDFPGKNTEWVAILVGQN